MNSTLSKYNSQRALTYLVSTSEGFEDWIRQNKLVERGTDYRTVAVIGCQSSGKSTLLNLLFDTTFDVMDETQGRQ